MVFYAGISHSFFEANGDPAFERSLTVLNH